MGLSFRGGFGASFGATVVLLACVSACGGKVGDGGSTPSPSTTSTTPPPPPGTDGGVAPRQVACKGGSSSLAKFPGERAAHVAVALDTGVVVLSSRDAADKVHVRALRDAAKGLEELSVHSGAATSVAASGRRIAFADDKGVVVVSVTDGARVTIPVAAPVRFLGLRDTDAFVVTDAGLTRYPLTGTAGGPEQAVCIGPTCSIPGVAGFDVRGATLAVVSTDGALYVGTDVGLRRAAIAAPGPVAVGSGFVAFVSPNAASPKLPSLGVFRPLDEEVELFPLPVTKSACAPNQVDVLGLASDGARLAFNTKESYPCAESPQNVAFASRASRPEAGLVVAGATGAAALAIDDVCAYALLGNPDASLGSFEAPAR